MKIRSGFVSNSSSSSFIVIDTHRIPDDFHLDYDGEVLTLGREGEMEFGWGPEIICDMWSRFNFAYLQAQYREGWMEQLNRVIKKRTGAVEIVWEVDGYIDHQSNAGEGANVEIFDTDTELEQFLFGKDSKIVLDNDNH